MQRPVLVHVPGDGERALVLLHGSHGSEHDLLPLAASLAPGAAVIAVRGTVRLGDGWAHFRRFPDRRVDTADLLARLPPLANALREAHHHHGWQRRPVVVGFSNGAITAAALLLRDPDLFSAAVLLRPLRALDDARARLDGTPVLVVDGARDDRRSPADGERAVEQLRRAGAAVTHRVLDVGHPLTDQDVQTVRTWLAQQPGWRPAEA